MERKNDQGPQPMRVTYGGLLARQQKLASKEKNDDPVADFKMRTERMSLLAESGAIKPLAELRHDFKANFKTENWKENSSSPEAVAIVKDATAIERAILMNPTEDTTSPGGIIIPGRTYSKKSQGSLESKAHLGIPLGHIGNPDIDNKASIEAKRDEEVDMSYVEMASGVPYGSMNSKGGASNVEAPHEASKVEGAPKPEARVETKKEEPKASSSILRPKTFNWKDAYKSVTYGEAAYTPVKMPEIKKAPMEVDIDLNKLEAEALAEKDRQAEIDRLILEAKNTKMETMENALENRKKGAMERLKGLGLKTLDGYKNLKPGYKIAIGVGLAGTAVLTGGWLAGIAAGVQKGLSMASMSRGFYEKDVAKKEAQGKEINKDRSALKAIGLGILASACTSALLENLGPIMDHLGEGASKLMHTLKDLYVPADAATSGIEVPTDIANSPSMLEAIADSKPDWIDLPDYTVEAGDNLTKILKDHVIEYMPEAANLSDFQRENMIQNMLAYAKTHPLDADFMTVNQFADPNLIHPGDVIDLNRMKDVFSHANFARFAGDTLVDHASKLATNQ